MFNKKNKEQHNTINTKPIEKPFYGLITDVEAYYDNRGYMTKIISMETAYILDGQLLFVNIPISNAKLSCFPIYAGAPVRFCDSEGNNPIIEYQTDYIIKLEKESNKSFPKEVYEIVRKYVENISIDEIDPMFWYLLDLTTDEKVKQMLKK